MSYRSYRGNAAFMSSIRHNFRLDHPHNESTIPSVTLQETIRGHHNTSALTQNDTSLYYKSRNSYNFIDSLNRSYTGEEDTSSLSSFTQFRNYLVKTDMERYDRKHKDTSLTKDLHKDVAQKMLRSVTREIKCLSYKLSTGTIRIFMTETYQNLYHMRNLTELTLFCYSRRKLSSTD